MKYELAKQLKDAGFPMKKVILLIMGLSLIAAACNANTSVSSSNVPNPQPGPGSFCIPCVGPHLDIDSGEIKYFGTGPGIRLY